jgi:D-sedoheptulose 7-phosphate isomerase
MSDPISFTEKYVQDITGVFAKLNLPILAKIIGVIEKSYQDGRRLFLAGNGGSASTASHMASDIMKAVSKGKGKTFHITALSDNISLLTSIANDIDYSEVFAAQLAMIGHTNDVFMAISGSGNSPNIIRAVEEARRQDMCTIGLLGMDGGQVKDLVDSALIVPSFEYGAIETAHLLMGHCIAAYFAGTVSPRESR